MKNINNYLNFTVTAMIIAVFMLVAVPVSAEVTNGDDDVSFSAPSSDAPSNTDSGTVSNGSDDVSFTAPVTGGQNPSTGPGAITNGDDDGAGVQPVNNGNPGGQNPGGSNPGGSNPGGNNTPDSTGGSKSGISTTTTSGAPTVTFTITSCPLITKYMRIGANNNGQEVAKLQIFLRTSQKLNVDVTGIFDQKTEDAVKAFQRTFLSDIMGPWDATRPSGIVYITTVKKINEITCMKPLTISSADQAIIDAYKRGNQGQDDSSAFIGSSTSTTSSSTTIGQENEANSNVASVGNASIFKRFWGFVTSLFGNLFMVSKDQP